MRGSSLVKMAGVITVFLILYYNTNVQTVHVYCCIHGAYYIYTGTAVYTDTVCIDV